MIPVFLGAGEEVEVRTEQMQFEQLPALASEVARVEMVREYAGEYRFLCQPDSFYAWDFEWLSQHCQFCKFVLILGIRVRAMNFGA